MSAASLLKYLHLAYLAKPVADRVIYRKIRKLRAGHLVGIGLGSGELPRKMIQLALQCTHRKQVRFTGIDLFEMRSGGPAALSLKRAHSLLAHLGARIQLVPGDPFSALARTANSLQQTDLIVIRSDLGHASMQRAWFYVPRMLHDDSLVLVEEPAADGQPSGYRLLDRSAVQQLAADRTPRRRAA